MEFRRKVFHALYGTAAAFLIHYRILGTWFFTGLLLLGLAVSAAAHRWRIPVIAWFLDTFEREADRATFPGRGAIYYTAGILLALLIFPDAIAAGAVMVLAWGDSFGPLFGMRVKRPKYQNRAGKNVEGLAAGTAAGALAAWWFVGPIAALISSIVAMAFEFEEMRIGRTLLNDNLVIPIIAGGVMYLVLLF